MSLVTHQQKLELYHQGLTDKDIGEMLGISAKRVGAWRSYYKLPNKNCNHKRQMLERTIEYIPNCPMEDALTEAECEVMRAFLGSLENLKRDMRPGTKINILSFARAWGENYFQNKAKEEELIC